MSENRTYERLMKLLILLVGICAAFFRGRIPADHVNSCMAAVNCISFMVSYNLWAYMIYQGVRERYKTGNQMRSFAANVVMLVYISIFISNLIFVAIGVYLYSAPQQEWAVRNDILSIASLSLAIAGDLPGRFFINLISMMFFE